MDNIIFYVPMKPKGMKESWETFHHHENGNGEKGPRGENKKQHNAL